MFSNGLRYNTIRISFRPFRYSALSDFLDVLEPPLQIHKPNKYKIISMDIPICRGDLCFCVDVLDALTKDFFARKGNPVEETAELGEVRPSSSNVIVCMFSQPAMFTSGHRAHGPPRLRAHLVDAVEAEGGLLRPAHPVRVAQKDGPSGIRPGNGK